MSRFASAFKQLMHKRDHLPDVSCVIGYFGLESGLTVDRTPHLITWGLAKPVKIDQEAPYSTIQIQASAHT
jgi:hypothetical protein